MILDNQNQEYIILFAIDVYNISIINQKIKHIN